MGVLLTFRHTACCSIIGANRQHHAVAKHHGADKRTAQTAICGYLRSIVAIGIVIGVAGIFDGVGAAHQQADAHAQHVSPTVINGIHTSLGCGQLVNFGSRQIGDDLVVIGVECVGLLEAGLFCHPIAQHHLLHIGKQRLRCVDAGTRAAGALQRSVEE